MTDNWLSRTDKIVANFTRDILGVAREEGVEFDYVGKKADKKTEIGEAMKVNSHTVSALLKKDAA